MSPISKAEPTGLPGRYLTIDQTAVRLGYTIQTIRLFILEGRLPAVDIATNPDGRCSFYRISENATIGPKLASHFA